MNCIEVAYEVYWLLASEEFVIIWKSDVVFRGRDVISGYDKLALSCVDGNCL